MRNSKSKCVSGVIALNTHFVVTKCDEREDNGTAQTYERDKRLNEHMQV